MENEVQYSVLEFSTLRSTNIGMLWLPQQNADWETCIAEVGFPRVWKTDA